MKFGQLTEYNMINISLEKSCTKCGGEARSTVRNVIKFLFIVCPSGGLPIYIKTKVQKTCFYL